MMLYNNIWHLSQNELVFEFSDALIGFNEFDWSVFRPIQQFNCIMVQPKMWIKFGNTSYIRTHIEFHES